MYGQWSRCLRPGSNKTRVSFLGKSCTQLSAPLRTKALSETQISRPCFCKKVNEGFPYGFNAFN